MKRRTEHGYVPYTRGCRCEVCKAVKADYMRERRAAGRRRAVPGVKVPAVLHGSRSAYEEHGCRCDLCCQTNRVYGHCGRRAAEAARTAKWQRPREQAS